MRKSIAVTAIAATTLGGAAAGATILGPGLAGAQDGDDAGTEEAPAHPMFADAVAEALQPLVDDGTIDETQRDAVVEQLESALPDRWGHGPGRHGPRLPIFGGEVADLLGLEPSEIADALRDGQSLADLAEANGVDPQALVDAIVAATEARLDEAVEDGRIDSERAAEMLDEVTERAEDVVNGELPGPTPGFGRPGRFLGPDEPAAADPAA